jgi:hypothetical protein
LTDIMRRCWAYLSTQTLHTVWICRVLQNNQCNYVITEPCLLGVVLVLGEWRPVLTLCIVLPQNCSSTQKSSVLLQIPLMTTDVHNVRAC